MARAADGRISVTYGPHALIPAADYLRRLWRGGEDKSPLQIHLAETAHEVEECRRDYGCTPVEHLQQLGLLSTVLSPLTAFTSVMKISPSWG